MYKHTQERDNEERDALRNSPARDRPKGRAVPKRLADGRTEELLDGIMRIISVEGFSALKVADLAPRLHCSVATLYKIASSKDSLVVLALTRWGKRTLEDIEVLAEQGAVTASDRARAYFRAGAESVGPLSLAFFTDVDRFESTRIAWLTTIANPYIDRFVELLVAAQDAGEVRRVSPRFLGEMFRQIGFVTRDERILSASELTPEQAVLEVDRIIWEGISVPQAPTDTSC
jgi:AcrR family transcriptional regulator